MLLLKLVQDTEKVRWGRMHSPPSSDHASSPDLVDTYMAASTINWTSITKSSCSGTRQNYPKSPSLSRPLLVGQLNPWTPSLMAKSSQQVQNSTQDETTSQAADMVHTRIQVGKLRVMARQRRRRSSVSTFG